MGNKELTQAVLQGVLGNAVGMKDIIAKELTARCADAVVSRKEDVAKTMFTQGEEQAAEAGVEDESQEDDAEAAIGEAVSSLFDEDTAENWAEEITKGINAP